MNCPACGYYNPEGQQRCFHCALPLPAGATADAFCAAHSGVRATGACSRCGTFGCGSCLSQHGADWLCPACSARLAVLPWDERATLGLWRAWWRTSVQIISNPVQTLSNAAPDAPLGSSLLFSVLSLVAGFGPTLVLWALVVIPAALIGASRNSGLSRDFGTAGVAMVPVLFIVYAVMLVVFQVAAVLLGAGLEHLGLMVVGAKPKSYQVSVRAYALSMGPYLVGLMPFCGVYVFLIWSLVVRIIAHLHLHKTTAGKATAGVLLPVAVACGGVLAFYVAVIGLAAGLAR